MILPVLVIYESWVSLSELLVVVSVLGAVVTGAVGLLRWGFKSQPNVIVQKGSFRINKYPLYVVTAQGVQQQPNIAYAEIAIENVGKARAEKCEVEVILKSGGKEVYSSKVVSADSTRTPNPLSVSLDPRGGTIGFHPLCLGLGTLQAFLPNHSLGVPGAFDGTLVRHGEYEVYGKVSYDGRQGESGLIGRVKVPEDFLEKSTIPNDVQVQVDQGGFAVYLVKNGESVRARIYGKHSDNDVGNMVLDYLLRIPQIDSIVDDNGRLRRWKILDLNTRQVELTSVSAAQDTIPS